VSSAISKLAANALGVCDAAVEQAMQLARREKRAGKLLHDHQLVQLKLNEMHLLTESLRSYVMRTAWEMDHHLQGVDAVLVMNYATTVIQRVTALNLDIHTVGGGVSTRWPTSWCAMGSSGRIWRAMRANG
jgi:alkylation response protein AidB-like acyl-CoA dehydrogenase